MVLLTSSEAFLQQSTLLISARPTTTRITTRYSLPRRKPQKSKTSKPSTGTTTDTTNTTKPEPQDQTQQQTTPLHATLTIKTYDPVSGVVLKYTTNRGAEVGRLLAGLGRCGAVMGSGKIKDDGLSAGDHAVGDEGQGKQTQTQIQSQAGKANKDGVAASAPPPSSTTASGTVSGTGTGGSGKSKGKKKGKK